MKLYADRPFRRVSQFLSDLFALAVTALAIRTGLEVHAQVMELRAPGDGLVDAGSGLRNTFDSAANSADDVPLVGGTLARALHTGSTAGIKLADAGRWQIDAVQHLAFWLAFLIIAVPVTFLVVTWLPLRWRFARRATAGARLRGLGTAGFDLLALRALTAERLPRLATTTDVTEGWREQDPVVIAELARWELRRMGLRAVR
ncbi:hypothetical protein [Amycolatopsis sp. GM8]|uniref:hypothetical protein n=1 Tax=Amycolatopsis sp. GM8 TaxID=2896530 RepID=UPI001F26FDFA|nr:hypothetical protein [Amycolatopsis sp. GM8]